MRAADLALGALSLSLPTHRAIGRKKGTLDATGETDRRLRGGGSQKTAQNRKDMVTTTTTTTTRGGVRGVVTKYSMETNHPKPLLSTPSRLLLAV
uniref:Putative secreted protein n=1 Tax=Anopheles marajoara TaxID=58244 RepID=A0A2M4CAH4_9DIPT